MFLFPEKRKKNMVGQFAQKCDAQLAYVRTTLLHGDISSLSLVSTDRPVLSTPISGFFFSVSFILVLAEAATMLVECCFNFGSIVWSKRYTGEKTGRTTLHVLIDRIEMLIVLYTVLTIGHVRIAKTLICTSKTHRLCRCR